MSKEMQQLVMREKELREERQRRFVRNNCNDNVDLDNENPDSGDTDNNQKNG